MFVLLSSPIFPEWGRYTSSILLNTNSHFSDTLSRYRYIQLLELPYNMEQSVYESLMEPMSLIEDNLFLGNRLAASSPEILKSCGISSVVQIQTIDIPAFHPGAFRYHLITLTGLDQSDLNQVLPDALRFIDSEVKTGGKVLVHCDNGVTRSASVVIAYIMYSQGKSATEALPFVKSKRLCVAPNDGLMQQLQTLTPERLAEMLAIRAG